MGANWPTRPRSGSQSTWNMDPPHEACANRPTVSICLPFPPIVQSVPCAPFLSESPSSVGSDFIQDAPPRVRQSDAFETAFLMTEQLSSANQNDQGGCHAISWQDVCRLVHRWWRQVKTKDRQSFVKSETSRQHPTQPSVQTRSRYGREPPRHPMAIGEGRRRIVLNRCNP
ncbi:hypothetical protein BT67DRAFT_14913 [Trichocladium antarcticum]|uniref:Uncharacterized protein n=1 Tax=Trichocladium antarcticum TaxID=1450529 RepID=A0AAN6UTF1_9PEZI|nr:hypothetical protein BT67DRAFT_14913 [Trichocladium antarcticum]